MKSKLFSMTQPVSVPVQHNGPLAKMISEASNPYHELHVAKAYALKSPKVNFTPPHPLAGGNPWMMVGKK